MVNNNYPQITSITSEALQSQIRALLPSQEGFGTDLMAQNVIVPIIDLTSAAEGSSVAQNLQTALAFGSQTAFEAEGSTDIIANTAGFYRIIGTSSMNISGTTQTNSLTMSDGLSTKTIWAHKMAAGSVRGDQNLIFEYVVFLDSGHSISAVSSNAGNFVIGSSRQIADINGTLVNPSGFSPQ